MIKAKEIGNTTKCVNKNRVEYFQNYNKKRKAECEKLKDKKQYKENYNKIYYKQHKQGFMKKKSVQWEKISQELWIRAVVSKFVLSRRKQLKIKGRRFYDTKSVKQKLIQVLELKKCVIALLKKYLERIRKKYKAAEEILILKDDLNPEDTEKILADIYGGTRYHVASHELFNFDRSKVNYTSLKIVKDEIRKLENLEEEDRIMYEEVKDTLNCIIISVSQDEAEIFNDGKPGRGKARFCDENCRLPDFWATQLHNALKYMVDERTSFPELQFRIANFEDCPSCCIDEYPACLDEADCLDNIKLLQLIQPHCVKIRSLLTYIYQVRAANFWLMEVDAAIFDGDWKAFVEITEGKSLKLPREIVEKVQNQEKQEDSNLDDIVREKFGRIWWKFEKACKDFPNASCSVCHMWLKQNKIKVYDSFEAIPGQDKETTQEIINDLKTENKLPINICSWCLKNLSTGIVPALSKNNKMGLDDIPDEIACLNIFELILIKLARSFQSIFKLKPLKVTTNTGDWVNAVKGMAVHLPLPLEETHQYLGTKLPSTNCLNIIVDSCPTKKGIVWRSLVNLEKVYTAIDKLKKINVLYKNVEVNEKDAAIFREENLPVSLGDFDKNKLLGSETVQSMLKHTSECEPYTEVTVEPIYSNPETALSDTEIYRTMKISSKPLDNKDEQTDVLCYPELYPKGQNGMYKKRQIKITPAMFLKHRFRNTDGRFRRNQQYLFDELGRKYTRCIEQGIYAMLNTSANKGLTCGQLLKQIEEKIQQLEANLSTMFAKNRGSKEYWRQKCSDLQAMDERFGPETWFLTLSCAEFYWADMRDYLIQMNSDLDGVNKMRTSYLCALDPVSVSEQFKRRFDAFMKFVLLDEEGPLGKVSHYFARIEYQARGAPHVHMKIWVEDAPMVGKNSDKEIIEFIEQHIQCSIPPNLTSPTLHNLVKRFQVHECTKGCRRPVRRNGRFITQCRHGFPRKACDKTTLIPVGEAIKSRSSGRRIKKLYDLKRSSEHRFVNDYNPCILTLWEANMDIQYVGENSLVLNRYITSYITKGEKSASDEIWESINENKSLAARLFKYARMNMQKRETGAYEAVANLLGYEFFTSSDTVKFVNTYPSHQRKRKVMKMSELKEKEPDCVETCCHNMIDDYYPNRPDELEDTCLYEISKWYEYERKEPKSKIKFELKNNLGWLRKRATKPVVIKMPSFNQKIDAQIELYYRSLLMLFKPWRNEDSLLGNFALYREAFEDFIRDCPAMQAFHEMKQKIENAAELAKKLREDQEIENQVNNNQQQDAIDENDDIDLGESEKVAIDMVQLSNKIGELNKDQRKIFNIITAKIQSQKDGQDISAIRLLVSGVAGTGKSFLIHVIKEKVQSMYENDSLSVALMAPTGIAAFNINGSTIHRFFKLPVQHSAKGEAEYWKLPPDDRKLFKAQWSWLKLIIIDEFSMISNTTLATIDRRLSDCLGYSEPFGNKNIIMFGDLLQLAPVNAAFCFEELNLKQSKKIFKSETRYPIWKVFEYSELIENMRQKEDSNYAQLLSRVRIGSPTEKDIEQLKSRLIDPNRKGISLKEAAAYFKKNLFGGNCNAVCLLSMNEQVEAFNKCMLESENIVILTSSAIDSDAGGKQKTTKNRKQISAANKEKMKKASDTAGLETELEIGISARIMLRRNIDVKKGLVNGSLGTIIGIKKLYGIPYKLEIQFDQITGKTEIERISAAYEISKGITMIRKQFPICLAYAITIHKSQGLTLDSVLLDLGKSCFEDSMIYVALSRVRKLENVHLIDFDPGAIRCKQKAANEYNRLRVSICLPELPRWNILPLKYYKEKQNEKKKMTMILSADVQAKQIKQNKADNQAKDESLKRKKPVQAQVEPYVLYLENNGVSCYANSLVQCLIRLPLFMERINEFITSGFYAQNDHCSISCTELSQFNEANSQRSQNHMEAYILREAVSNEYAQPTQQDAFMFYTSLMECLQPANVHMLFSYTMLRNYTCPDCQHSENQAPDTMNFLQLHPKDEKQTFQSLLKYETLVNGTCTNPQCNRFTELRKRENITYGHDQKYLVVQLGLFRNGTDRMLNRQIVGYNASNITIFGTRFKTIGAILHTGPTPHRGHYRCCVRSTNGWMIIDDLNYGKIASQATFIRCLENVYILMLERI